MRRKAGPLDVNSHRSKLGLRHCPCCNGQPRTCTLLQFVAVCESNGWHCYLTICSTRDRLQTAYLSQLLVARLSMVFSNSAARNIARVNAHPNHPMLEPTAAKTGTHSRPKFCKAPRPFEVDAFLLSTSSFSSMRTSLALQSGYHLSRCPTAPPPRCLEHPRSSAGPNICLQK